LEEWDWKALCNQFRSIEQQAFQEMSEVEKKIPDDPSCEALYDLHLAKFCLFGRLHSTNLPYTRKIFVIYLRVCAKIKYHNDAIFEHNH